ncbi:MAG: sulfite exporter TauE/SafE family protein [Desulfobacterales bacterium]|nr:sulfite exporter TauE/SafE family protein [Desulfobacterales bacterium]
MSKLELLQCPLGYHAGMEFTGLLYAVYFAAGLGAGVGHCMGMCGPIVVSFSFKLQGKNTFVPHLLYNAGRISTYALAGGTIGAMGSFARTAAGISWVQQGVMIFTGLVIVFMGITLAGWIPFKNPFSSDVGSKGILAKGFRRLHSVDSPWIYYPLGLLLGLLPCGAVYTALMAVAGAGMEAKSSAGGFLLGFGLMLAFGLGTVPVLLLLGKLSGTRWVQSVKILHQVAPLLMILLGGHFIVKGISY